MSTDGRYHEEGMPKCRAVHAVTDDKPNACISTVCDIWHIQVAVRRDLDGTEDKKEDRGDYRTG